MSEKLYGFEALASDEMMTVDGGGYLTDIFSSIISISDKAAADSNSLLFGLTVKTVKVVAAVGNWIAGWLGW